MHFDAVHAFVAVARSRSFSEAGRLLRVPRSTLSRQIQRLEASLGVRLLERTTRHVRLTEAGERYFLACARAFEELEVAEQGVREAGTQPCGTLRITAPNDVARELPEGLLAEFHRRYPHLELVFEITQRRVDLVAEGLDLALRGAERLDDSSLIARKLVSHRFALYASPSYLRAHGQPETPEELDEHELIAFAPGCVVLPWRLEAGQGVVEVLPEAWLRANELGLLRSALIDGLGIGVLEQQRGARDVAAGLLERVLPEHTMSGGALYAVYPSAQRVPAKVRAFVELLLEHLEPHVQLTRP
jgi:DNA-binding transcriptional LysR family regulator